MKKNLTLGLIVFFVGVLLTACGGSKSSDPQYVAQTSDSRINPNVQRPANCADPCTINQYGTITSANQTRFEQTFGLSDGSSSTGLGNTNIAPLFVDDGSGDFEWNGENTVKSGLSAWLSCELLKDCDLEYGSNSSSSNGFSNTSQLSMNLQYNFQPGQTYYDSIETTIGSQTVTFIRDSSTSNVLRNGNYVLVANGNSWTLARTDGNVGVIR